MGLTEQIENSSRGHLPNGPQLLFQRIEDELVRRALERGCAREDVADVLGMSRRTTFTKERRARAIDFPLDAIDRGGRPPKSQSDYGGSRSDRSDKATASVSSDGEETEAAESDTAGSAAGRPDGAETTDNLDEDALDEIWDKHHSALHPKIVIQRSRRWRRQWIPTSCKTNYRTGSRPCSCSMRF